jgi:hypothetical protein
VQLHPYIITLIAQDRMATMHAQAESDRRARAAIRSRREAKRHTSRNGVAGRVAPAQPGSWPSIPPIEQLSHHDDARLVSAGRAGTDECR